MNRKIEELPNSQENFEFPSEGKLSPDNRWDIMANLIHQSEFEEKYAKNFRKALGKLIIKEKLETRDRETIEQIKENPYLPYFLRL